MRYNDTNVNILGTNLLENVPLPSDVSLDDITSPLVLYQKNPPPGGETDAKRPAIYCVGVNQTTFPSTGSGTGTSTPSLMKKGDDDRLNKPRIPGQVHIVDLNVTTKTNLVSIFAMVIWDNGHISHYFAGDADFVMERQVKDWSGTSGDFKTLGGSITTIKLSHHGSRWSTPTDLLDNYLPMNIIVSCGREYGHPGEWLISD